MQMRSDSKYPEGKYIDVEYPDGEFQKNELFNVLKAKQRKYDSISQLRTPWLHRPREVGYDPDQPDELDNVGYAAGSASSYISNRMAGYVDKVTSGQSRLTPNQINQIRLGIGGQLPGGAAAAAAADA